MAKISAEFPAGVIGTTRENLAEAAAGENYEWKEMYPGFAKVAREEDSMRLRRSFESIVVARSSTRSGY
jgi:rubrerythrin